MRLSEPTRRGALLAAIAGGSAAVAPPAKALARTPYILPRSEKVLLTSAINGITYSLYVRTPLSHASGDRRHPVIVTLDADYSFPIVANHLEHLADRMNQAPEAIVVSVAYPGVYPDHDRYRAERTRDYTPVFWPDGGYGPKFQAASGGGPKFLRMLAEEALPLIDRLFQTDPDDRTLVGHSYGGLFGAWVLQTQPQLFNRYLLVSPSLWYADRMMLTADTVLSASITRKTRVYLGVGSWEEQPERGGYMVSQLEQYAARLTALKNPDLIVKHRVFEDETHASIFPACFSTGIRHLFQTMD